MQNPVKRIIMMKTLGRFLSLFCLMFLLPAVSFAWNALGHMVIAEIAYQNLKPDVREKVDALVENLHQQYPEMKSFANISYWPDALRGQKIETYTHWHYIDIAFSTDGTPLQDLVDDDNAVWAVNNIEPVVKNTRANAYERARFLAFLTHIVGDLHQPLHTVSYISAATPNGDKGGNDFYVRYNNERVKLHRLWDGGVGVFEGEGSQTRAHETASNIMALYPESGFGAQVNDITPANWANEGLENAKKYVYNTAPNQALSAAYVEEGRRISEKEAALAGYRLAKILNSIISVGDKN
ncbi:hypothetical protein AQUSIP_18860 [Aquicella siphonis]|uniref:Nuclease S1 n=1 Tax=Aquicella siphonis TaxID=254247 RepID=A0A5E4PHR0_9COXI|nr:S1/P1 nuclease [Aquicella siphonis]VVC76570.1 hypothetical protein AQUSIP_18860 [Aquicella siphonis]